MNPLEAYIKEVVSVEDISAEWVDQVGAIEEPMYYVSVKANCYGRVDEYKEYWSKSEWEKVKERGWFTVWY